MKKIFLCLLCIFLVTGCNSTTGIENGEKVYISEPTIEKKIEVVDLESKTRPIAVMINNINVAQPYQTGLNDAYIVYEIIVEGGITRLLAVFKDSNIANVGTIRSTRSYYLDYAMENDAVLVHFGGSDLANEEIAKFGINNVNGSRGDNFYWREKFPVGSEHTVYSSMEKINNVISKRGYRTTSDKKLLLDYSVDEIDLSLKTDSIKADNVKIVYSNSQTTEFIYNPETKLYTRKSNGNIRVDQVTKETFTTKNIITYQVKNYTSAYQGYGRQELENIGSGEGYYITGGNAIKITWEKKSREEQTIYKYLDGTPLKVNDGNTYIEIQPVGQKLEIN